MHGELGRAMRPNVWQGKRKAFRHIREK